jgi:hypothetical protein
MDGWPWPLPDTLAVVAEAQAVPVMLGVELMASFRQWQQRGDTGGGGGGGVSTGVSESESESESDGAPGSLQSAAEGDGDVGMEEPGAFVSRVPFATDTEPALAPAGAIAPPTASTGKGGGVGRARGLNSDVVVVGTCAESEASDIAQARPPPPSALRPPPRT